MQRRTALFGLTLIAIAAASSGWTAFAQALAPASGGEIRFELQDTYGRTVGSADLHGRWTLVFFGYTSCPDICPTVLLEIAKALAQLGPFVERVQPIFVSVDPQRDTPKILREYVNDFDGRILALTGTPDQLNRAAKSFGVQFFKIPGSAPDNYTIAHSSIMTLLGPEGGLVTRMSTDVSADQIATTLKKLMPLDGF
jgi:protein SCO1